MSSYSPPRFPISSIFNPIQWSNSPSIIPTYQSPLRTNVNTNGKSFFTLTGSNQSITLNADKDVILNTQTSQVKAQYQNTDVLTISQTGIKPSAIIDVSSSTGISGQVLSSTGSSLRWIASGSGATEEGFSYRNTTNSSILSIPTTVTVIPIVYAVAPTISYIFNWKGGWDILATPANNNRLVYTGSGTNKKFSFRADIQISVSGTSATVYIALYKNGSCLTNGFVSQSQGIFGALNPSVELVHFEIPITATTNDYFELYTYGSSTGVSISPITPATNLFSPTTFAPAVTIECQEVKI